MFSKNSPNASRLRAALFCVIGCTALVFNLANVSAQNTRFNAGKQNLGGAPVVTATLTDAFPDPNGDGRAAFGAEVTYTATITNSGETSATNAVFTNTIDNNSTLVAGSVQVQPDLSSYSVRCTFSAGNGGGGCGSSSGPYGVTDANLDTIIGGQYSYLTIAASNSSYNAGTGIFQFDATVQDLIPNALGTLDGVTPDAAGINLFLQSSRVISGTGSVSVANAEGTGTFTAPDQPYFRYSQILQQNEITGAKTIQVNVPNTVDTFSVDFLVSTKIQVKVVINEVLANPGGTISDANGEWFEFYNAGALPVNLKNFLFNDYSAADNGLGCELHPNGTTTLCSRPIRTVMSDVIIQPGGYVTFGNTTNTTNNGGVPIDYAYGAELAFANSIDGIRLRTPNALVIDKMLYANGAAISAQNGISRELKNPALDNSNMDDQTNWADAPVTSVYGPGGRGTPKAQNSTFTPFAETFADKSSGDAASAVKNFVPVINNAGETVSTNLGTITPGGSAVVTYRVTIADPPPAGVTQLSNQGSVSGANFLDVVTDDTATGTANDATITPIGTLAPTSALVSISGQVSDSNGRAVTGAQVALVDSDGTTHTSRTNSFGYYRFVEIAAGSTVMISVRHKQHVFAPQVISVNDDITDLNFTAQNFSLF